jgi:hypothetical protein
MKRQILTIFTVFVAMNGIAQVGINTGSPQALLDIRAKNTVNPEKEVGFIVPRIQEFPATNPGANQNGMLVFISKPNVADYWMNSFYYWHNADMRWDQLLDANSAELDYNKIIVSGNNLYDASGTVATLSDISTPRTIRFLNIDAPDASHTITAADQRLNIGKSGQYLLIFSAGLVKLGAGSIMSYDAEIQKNGISFSPPIIVRISMASEVGRAAIFSITSIVNLNVNDKISVQVSQVTPNVSGLYAQLNSPATLFLQRLRDL